MPTFEEMLRTRAKYVEWAPWRKMGGLCPGCRAHGKIRSGRHSRTREYLYDCGRHIIYYGQKRSNGLTRELLKECPFHKTE